MRCSVCRKILTIVPSDMLCENGHGGLRPCDKETARSIRVALQLKVARELPSPYLTNVAEDGCKEYRFAVIGPWYVELKTRDHALVGVTRSAGLKLGHCKDPLPSGVIMARRRVKSRSATFFMEREQYDKVAVLRQTVLSGKRRG